MPLSFTRRRAPRRHWAEPLEPRRLLAVSVTSPTVDEGNSGTRDVVFFVTVSGVTPGEPVVADYSTVNGTAIAGQDFGAVDGSLIFTTSGTKTVSVPIIGDTVVEPDETFFLDVSADAGAARGTCTIRNDDVAPPPPLTVSVADNGTAEGTPPISHGLAFTIALSRAMVAGDQPVTVNFATADNTATAGVDYAPVTGSYTFAPDGASSLPILVNLTPDWDFEPDETFFFRLTGVTAPASIADGEAVGRIINDDQPPPAIGVGDAAAAEGTPPTPDVVVPMVIALSRPLAQGEPSVTVNYATADGTAVAGNDYLPRSGSHTFVGGAAPSVQIDVATIPDERIEPDESFFLRVTGFTGAATLGDAEGVGTIRNDDAPPPPDFLEPNDTFDAATPIGVAGRLLVRNVSIHAPGNDDYYLVRPAQRVDSMSVRLEFNSAEGNLNLYVYDAARSLVASATTSGGDAKQVSVPLRADVASYFIRVAGAGGDSSLGYRLIVVGPPAAPDRFEPNNSQASQATDLGVVHQRLEPDLSLHDAQDRDYFQLTTAGPGLLGALVTRSPFLLAPITYGVAILDAGGGTLAFATSSSGARVEAVAPVQAGTYYVVVFTDDLFGDLPAYDLLIAAPDLPADRLEPNNTFATSTNLGLLDPAHTEPNLSIHNAADVDVFGFVPARSGQLNGDLSFAAANGAVVMSLYDAAENLVATATPNATGAHFEFGVTAGQKYYVRVSGTEGSTNPGYALTLTPPPATSVMGRRVFYNHSAFDGGDPAATAADDNSIAPDKQALLPGQRASFANVTSYTRGINGVMVDVSAAWPAPDAADFVFRTGLVGATEAWAAAPAPRVTLRPGAGVAGSDRIVLTWPDGAIRQTWLEVTVKANPRTGLSAPDVFYFGNLPGAAGGAAAPHAALVTAADYFATRGLFRRGVPISDPYDFNRDGRADVFDLATARRNLGRSLPALSPPAPVTSAAPLRARSAVRGVLGDGAS